MYYKRFAVTGIANTTVLDAGLVSLVGEKYHIKAVLITVDQYFNNIIEGWIGTQRVLEVPDYIFDTFDFTAATINCVSTTKIIRLPIELDIPEGQIFKIGLNCGANLSLLYGSYEYVIVP